MSIREFRFILASQNHEAAVAIYRDGLGLAIPESSERGPGTLFRAGPAMIELTASFSLDDPRIGVLRFSSRGHNRYRGREGG